MDDPKIGGRIFRQEGFQIFRFFPILESVEICLNVLLEPFITSLLQKILLEKYKIFKNKRERNLPISLNTKFSIIILSLSKEAMVL